MAPTEDSAVGAALALGRSGGPTTLGTSPSPSAGPVAGDDVCRSSPACCPCCGWHVVTVWGPSTPCDDDGGPTDPGGSEIKNGIPIKAIKGAQGSETFYTMTVPAGKQTLNFRISGGSGDADLYVRFGA